MWGIRGRQRDSWSTYKRVSKENLDYELESNPPAFTQSHGKDLLKPSWMLSLPHVIVATISSLLFGYHLGVVNDTLEAIAIDLGFSGDTLSEGLVVSTCLAGAFAGSIFSGSIADGFGRRRAFQMTAIPMIIGTSISAISKSLGGMLIGRFCVGIGMGIGPPAAAMYVAEVSPAYVRGTFGSFTQIATCFGLMAAFFIGIPAKETNGWWRICFWVPVIPAALLAICIELCAESPHWLFKNGRGTEAEAQLEKLLGPLYVKAAIAELSKVEGKGDETEDVSVLELFRGRHSRVVFIGGTLFALQQLSGINAVFYFSSVVFKKAGVPANTANICVGVVNLAGSLAASVLMDKLGRRVLLIGSFFGMAMAMIIEVNATGSLVSSNGAVYLSVGGILMFVLSFALGTGPVPSLLLSEILPNRIRAKAMAFCMAVHWVVNFFVGLLFLRLLEQLGPEILYSSFATFCLIAVVFVKKNVMETKGKTLQEIEMALLPPAQ